MPKRRHELSILYLETCGGQEAEGFPKQTISVHEVSIMMITIIMDIADNYL